MDEYMIVSATLKHYGPELSILGGDQIEVSMYVVYADGSERTFTVYGPNLPQFIRNLRALDISKKSEVVI